MLADGLSTGVFIMGPHQGMELVERLPDVEAVIVSADKDLMPLVGPDVVLWDTMRDKVWGPDEVTERFGVRVEQLRDLLALTGDSSDNIPGVPSVGPKTAQQLLADHGDIDGIYANLEHIKRQKLRETLEQHRAQAFLSRDLVTLKDDCPLTFDLDALCCRTAQRRHLDGDVDTATLEPCLDQAARVELQRCEGARQTERDVEMTVVHGSGLDGDDDRLAGDFCPPKPCHAPDHEGPQHRRNSL